MEQFYKSPLSPFVIFRVAGPHFPAPVIGKPDLIELFAVPVDILFGSDGRMRARLNGILFRRKPIGIVAHGMQHIITFQPFIPGKNIGGDIPQRMTDMKAGARRVWKHVEDVILRLRMIDFRFINFIIGPIFLPFFFSFAKVVIHALKT